MRRYAYLITLMSAVLGACGARAETTVQGIAENAAPAQAAAPSLPITQVGSLSEGEVVIQLGDNTIDASQTTFKAGETYTFVITNYGTRAHDFSIIEPVAVKGSYEGAESGALLTVPKLNPGQTVTVEFVFPASAVRKQWEFASLNQNLYEDGMRWPIAVS